MSSIVVTLDQLAQDVLSRFKGQRLLVGIAGPPGSGKSTLADKLADGINRIHSSLAAVLPMDGYHYDDHVLKALSLLPRKGAPETFDTGGLRHMLNRLHRNDEPTIAVPVFDRSIEIARAGARLIPQDTGIVIVEGNYLLLKRPDWHAIPDAFTVTAMIETQPMDLRQRLLERWRHYGLSPDEIDCKLNDNDLPNGQVVINESVESMYVIRN